MSSGTGPVPERNALLFVMLALCISVWIFVVIKGDGDREVLYVLAPAVAVVALGFRARRQRRRVIEQAEREQGRLAALRLDAQLAVWDDKRLERIYAEIGEEEAARLRDQVNS